MKLRLALVLVAGLMLIAAAPVKTQSLLHSQARTFSQAEIASLPTTGYDVVSAQAGKVLIPLHIAWHFLGSTAFTNIASNANLAITNEGYGFTTALFEAASSGVSNLIANESDMWAFTGAQSELNPSPLLMYGSYRFPSDVEGNALVLRGFNGFNGNFTGGDASETLTISVAYLVLNISTGQFE